MDFWIKLVCFLGLILSVSGVGTDETVSTTVEVKTSTSSPPVPEAANTTTEKSVSTTDSSSTTSGHLSTTVDSEAQPSISSTAAPSVPVTSTQGGGSDSSTSGNLVSSNASDSLETSSETGNGAISTTGNTVTNTSAVVHPTTSVTSVNSSIEEISSTTSGISNSSVMSVTEQTQTSSPVQETTHNSTTEVADIDTKSTQTVTSIVMTSSLSSSALPSSTSATGISKTETSSQTGTTNLPSQVSDLTTTPYGNESKISFSTANDTFTPSSDLTSSNATPVTTLTNLMLSTSSASLKSSTSSRLENISSTLQYPTRMECIETESSGLDIILNLSKSAECKDYINDESGKKLAEMLCYTKRNSSEGQCIVKFNGINASSSHLGIHSILFQVDISREEVIEILQSNTKKLMELNIIAHTDYISSEDNQGIDKLTLWLAIAVLCCLVVLCAIFGFSVFVCNRRKLRTKDQQRLTEELHTVENGYHDNPTLEVTDTQPEMLEKKTNLNGELGDAWIVPLDNLTKEELEEEEDTHL